MPANVGVGCSTCDRSLTLSPWGRVTESGPGHWLLGWWWSTQRVSGGAFSCRRRTAACCCRIANIHLQEKKKKQTQTAQKKDRKKLGLGFFGTFLEFHLFFGYCSANWASAFKKRDHSVEFKCRKFFFFGQITFLCCNKPSLCALVSPDWTYFNYIIPYTITTTTFQLQKLQLGHWNWSAGVGTEIIILAHLDCITTFRRKCIQTYVQHIFWSERMNKMSKCLDLCDLYSPKIE